MIEIDSLIHLRCSVPVRQCEVQGPRYNCFVLHSHCQPCYLQECMASSSVSKGCKARPLSFSFEMSEGAHQTEDKHAHSQPPSLSSMQSVSSAAPSPMKRIRGVVMRKSIVYGNITHRLSKSEVASMRSASTVNHDHQLGHSRRNRSNHSSCALDGSESWYRWTVYVRGPQNEDLSYFIEKVVFILHETYADPIRGLKTQYALHSTAY